MRDIEWMRAYSRKNKKKQHRRNVRKNYRRVYKEIKWNAKQGMNDATIRFFIYDENVRRLLTEGYEVEKVSNYTINALWRVKW